MFARQTMSLELPTGFLGVFIGIAFGFVIGLFYYQTYRRHHYWAYSIVTGILAATLTPVLLHAIIRFDVSTVHAPILQFSAALVAVVFTNHFLYAMNKRRKSRTHRRVRQHSYAKDFAVASRSQQQATPIA